MVYNYGRARNLSSLINQTNTNGGVKKQGLPSTIGVNASVSAIYRNRIGCLCPTAYDFVNTVRTCGGGVGGIYRPRC